MWINEPDLKCVVLCAGSGSRVLPLSIEKAKVMIPIEDKPILQYVVNYWKQYSSDFIFVVNYKKEQVIEFAKELPINTMFVEQKELHGIADALSYVEDYVGERFIVVLGDCLCKGNFIIANDMEQGVGVWKTANEEDIRQSYSIRIKNNLVTDVVEKPKIIINSLCGMGFYFFNNSVFDYIKMTKPSPIRNEIEITDVIKNIINDGKKISPVMFEGDYLNVTYPQDLKRAQSLLF